MATWFTADLHINHERVLGYAKRPFATVEEMNAELVRRWKAVVRPKDHIYVLGDVFFGPKNQAGGFVRALPGVKYLVPGNHDFKTRKDGYFVESFKWVKDIAEISVEGQRIVLCHFAFLVWNQMHRGSWHLHGHSHGSLPDNPNARRLDVGVDAWTYAPVSFEEIKARMALKTFQPVDHHRTKDHTPETSQDEQADQATADGEAADPR